MVTAKHPAAVAPTYPTCLPPGQLWAWACGRAGLGWAPPPPRSPGLRWMQSERRGEEGPAWGRKRVRLRPALPQHLPLIRYSSLGGGGRAARVSEREGLPHPLHAPLHTHTHTQLSPCPCCCEVTSCLSPAPPTERGQRLPVAMVRLCPGRCPVSVRHRAGGHRDPLPLARCACGGKGRFVKLLVFASDSSPTGPSAGLAVAFLPAHLVVGRPREVRSRCLESGHGTQSIPPAPQGPHPRSPCPDLRAVCPPPAR